MSEAITETPLNPEAEVEVAVEEAPQTETETPAEENPQFSKLLQREQMERANLAKEVKSLKEMLSKALSAKTPEVRESRVDDLLNNEKFHRLAERDPEAAELFKAQVERTNAQLEKTRELERRQEARERFEDFMADKPPGFREAYTREQRRLMDELAEDGFEADETQLGIALGQWSKRWLTEKKTAAKPAVTAPGGNRILPQTGARPKSEAARPSNPFGLRVTDKIV